MNFALLVETLQSFVTNKCIPAEEEYESFLNKLPDRKNVAFWKVPRVMETLKEEAKRLGLWNLFLPSEAFPLCIKLKNHCSDLIIPERVFTNVEYATVCEILGQSPLAPEACNCSAPDTGNMEVLFKYGSWEQQVKYLIPLLQGTKRSAFAMTEPAVSSSDATQLSASLTANGSQFILNGRKWWITGAGHPDLLFYLVVVRSPAYEKQSRHGMHSIVLVPNNSKGIRILRPLTVFGYDDAPVGHCEIEFKDVVVQKDQLVGLLGQGFEILQSRLGPGRLHHCMRALGMAERTLRYMCQRLQSRQTFGRPLASHGLLAARVAQARVQIDAGRLLVHQAAAKIDKEHAKGARKEIGVAKIFVPKMLTNLLNETIQAYGAGGLCEDWPLASMYAHARTLHIADGPDEVHLMNVAKMELTPQAHL